jgi:hypothetical protein
VQTSRTRRANGARPDRKCDCWEPCGDPP